MCSRYIDENTKRKLYAESMGFCMNPNCRCQLFREKGDIIEKAHIDAYCETADNSFENLVLLCPTCHTDFDKNHMFTAEEVLSWKKIRQEELEKVFCKKFDSIEELKKEVVPLLSENRMIYENYFLTNKKDLWDKFEITILSNNKKLKSLFSYNMELFQTHSVNEYSNSHYISTFIAHVNEFEVTRSDKEKHREVLFPVEINSMFGIVPVEGNILPSTESLELLIKKLKEQDEFLNIVLGTEHPFIGILENGKPIKVFLDDTPRIRQLYYSYKCFTHTRVRLDSLNFALKYIHSRKMSYSFLDECNLKEIELKGKKIIFIYDYCLSKINLMALSPDEDSVVVNLHNWNGMSCISTDAYELAKKMNVKLLTMDDFYEYINEIKEYYF